MAAIRARAGHLSYSLTASRDARVSVIGFMYDEFPAAESCKMRPNMWITALLIWGPGRLVGLCSVQQYACQPCE